VGELLGIGTGTTPVHPRERGMGNTLVAAVEGDFVPVAKTTPVHPRERRVGENLVPAQEGAYGNQD
jgi:hypothetical protein